MRVCFLPVLPKLASARLRGYIPAQQLKRLGFTPTVDYQAPCDVVVLVKDLTDPEFYAHAKKIVYDVCDDHFSGEWEKASREGCRIADLVTCNSPAMRDIIKRETGRDAVVIDDPYESPECKPRCHDPVFWFGSRLNLPTLLPIVDQLPDLVVVTDAPGFIQWSPEAMEEAWEVCGMTVLPTGPKQGKSANRAVESIRRGLFPVCGRLPAYEELGLGVDDVPAEVAHRLAHPRETVEMVAALQDRVRERFSPQTVGMAWQRALSSI